MNKFSQQEIETFQRIFLHALRKGLQRNSLESFVATSVSTDASYSDKEAILIVMTVSSFAFRLMVLFNVVENQLNREYFIGDTPNQTFVEAFYEVANLCCGALNRDISRDISHLGMSVPVMLTQSCMEYIDALNPQYLESYSITLNETASVHATLCLSCSAPVSFSTDLSQIEEDAGALELF